MFCCQELDPPEVETIVSGDFYELSVENLREGYSGLCLAERGSRVVIAFVGEGPFSAWNKTQRGHHIQIGDQVLAVNEAVDCVTMREELHKVGTIRLKARSLPRSVVEISRSGQMLGLVLNDLVIEEIKDSGAVKEWMNSNLDSKIKLGDFLIEVNGFGDSPCMVDQIFSDTVRMVIVHV